MKTVIFHCVHCNAELGMQYQETKFSKGVEKVMRKILKDSKVLCSKCEKWGEVKLPLEKS